MRFAHQLSSSQHHTSRSRTFVAGRSHRSKRAGRHTTFKDKSMLEAAVHFGAKRSPEPLLQVARVGSTDGQPVAPALDMTPSPTAQVNAWHKLQRWSHQGHTTSPATKRRTRRRPASPLPIAGNRDQPQTGHRPSPILGPRPSPLVTTEGRLGRQSSRGILLGECMGLMSALLTFDTFCTCGCSSPMSDQQDGQCSMWG